MTETAIKNNKNKLRIAALALLGAAATLTIAVPASAESGQVEVKAQNESKLTLSLSTATSDFGTGLDPSGAASSLADVASYNDQPNGAYYVKKGDANFAQTVTVKSNKAWNGSVQATENTGPGAAGMTIAGGSLKWKSGNMTSFNDAQGGTTFTTGPDSSVFGGAPQPKGGNNTYNFDYSLRVLWTDDPGTFSSIVTYNAQQ